MNVFVFEYLTGGGLLGGPIGTGSLLREGLAMVSALAGDLAAMGPVSVNLLWDGRLPRPAALQSPAIRLQPVADRSGRDSAFVRSCRQADATILIAPELDGILFDCACRAEEAGAQLVGPSADWIRLASNKTATCDRWAQAGVPTPRGRLWQGSVAELADIPLPWVLKRNDGAGSEGVCRIEAARPLPCRSGSAALRVEAVHGGLPASVATLGGPAGRVFLPPCGQRLSGDGRFRYLGGWLLRDLDLRRRAERLARRAMEALPPVVGYVGLDVILGPDPSGKEDVMVEANPRLTTSYVGLRRAARGNLARWWLELARGGTCEPLRFDEVPIHFSACGTIES